MARVSQMRLAGPVRVQDISAPVDLRAFRRRWADLRGAAMLESMADDAFFGRYSIYAAEPITIFDSDDLRTLGGFSAWAEQMRLALPPTKIDGGGDPLPFVAGWIGALSYEAGRWIEPKAAWRHVHPWLSLGIWRLYDGAVIYDKQENRWFVTAVGIESERSRYADARIEALAAQVELMGRACELPTSAHDPNRNDTLVGLGVGTINVAQGEWNYGETEYLAKVARVIDYLHAGDIYQANISRRWRMALDRAPGEVYLDLCRANPAALAAFIRLDDEEGATRSAILSSSPELLLDVDANGKLLSRPIKGTRPRCGDDALDRQAAAELNDSIKERAELNMIIDLVRNDLGRVARFGSVQVREPGRIEYHPTVIHRTATIEAQLRDDADGFDALAGMFPGGSVTGAPKVRAMQIIHELEPDGRGAYCGAMGFVNVDRSMRYNLPIRTMMMYEGQVELSVGSGIVADSTPEAELAELYAKARGMLRALGRCGSG